MREVGGESKKVYVIQPKTSWLSNGKYHLQQLGKGALVAGLTLGGYGIWKRWWGMAVNTRL